MISNTLDEVANQILKNTFNTSEYVKRLLTVMEYDVPYTANELLNYLGLKSKETLRKNYIDPALNAELIKMTIPDKPKSKNQRYMKI